LSEWVEGHGLTTALIVLGAVLALKLAAVLNRKLFAALFKGKEDADSRTFAQSMVTAAYWLISILIVVAAGALVLGRLGLNTGIVFARALDWILSNGARIAIVIALAFVGLKVAGILSARLIALLRQDQKDIESQKRADTLGSVVRWGLRTVILVVATVMVLGQLGVQIGPIVAAAGVVGLAVGFGAQSLVQDVISGFFILLEDQVRVGDVVTLNDKGGLVERITLRMIILRDFAGNVHYVRNGKVDVVTNMTKEFSNYVFDVGVAYREDPDEVMKVIKDVGEELQQAPDYKDDILTPVEVVGLDKFADSAIVIKARIRTRPIKQWRVGREFNRRLKKRFDELGIEIPFPHLTLYPGKDKRGDSPTLKLEIQGNTPVGPA